MDPKGHIIDQKVLKMCVKRQKMQFLAEFTLAELGGTPLPPLTGKSSFPKTVSGKGGYPRPPPLNGKNPLSSF